MFELRCNQSGTSYPANDDRYLLIGSAGYCECRLSSVQRVEAVIVRYLEGWVIHDLQGTEVLTNDTFVNGRSVLRDGDQIQLGQHVLDVHGIDSAPSSSATVANMPCVLKMTTAGGLNQSEKIARETLVGASMVCDIPLIDESQFKTKQCLITVSENYWFVVDLAGAGGLQNRQRWKGFVRVMHGDRVQIGELKIQFELHESSCREIVPQPSPPPETNPPAETNQLGNVDTDVEKIRLHRPAPRRTLKADPVAAVAQEIFNKVKALHVVTMQPTPNTANSIRRLVVIPRLSVAERRFVAGFKESALKSVGELLAQDPWNHQVLMSFARMCDAGQMYHLCLSVLNVLLRIDRNDAGILKSIARVCLVLAEKEPKYYLLSIKYWEQARARVPGEAAKIDSLIRNISAQHAINRNRMFDEMVDTPE